MDRRTFLKTGALLAGGAVVFSVAPLAAKTESPAATAEGISGSIEDLLGEGVWLDSADGVTPDGLFTPALSDTVLPPMDLRINDADYGWLHRYISQTEDGYQPQISVSGNLHVSVYSSIRPVPELNNVFFVDLLFQPQGGQAFSDQISVTFDQVETAVEGRTIYQKQGVFQSVRFFPNPVNGPVSLHYRLYAPAAVSVSVYDMQGRVALPERRLQPALSQTVSLPLNRASGVYLVKLQARGRAYFFKLVEVK